MNNASSDIFAALVQLASGTSKNSKDKTFLSGSISNATKNLIMTFPTMCDSSLSPSTASLISKANERNIVTMLQILFSAYNLNGVNGNEIIKQLHNNINSNQSISDIMDSIDNIVANVESYNFKEKFENCNQATIGGVIREMQEELKRPQKRFPVNSFSESSVNDFEISNGFNTIIVREVSNSKEEGNFTSANKDPEQRNRDNLKSEVDTLGKVLLDSDIKKSNEISPSLLIVKYNQVDNNGELVPNGIRTFVAGVKSRLISVDSLDIIERIVAKNKTKINFINFIKATTGETKFVRDFLLCIDQAKIDAKNAVKKGPTAAMWKVLENRSMKNNMNSILKEGNDATAITTLVINQETANLIKKYYDFDIFNIKNARMILGAYNLLGIIVCDESLEVAKFLYTGNDAWESQAYSYLEKSEKDNSYKKVVNLLTKMN